MAELSRSLFLFVSKFTGLVKLVLVTPPSVPNFLSRIGSKVSGGGVVWGGLTVSLASSLNPSCIELELGLGFDKIF